MSTVAENLIDLGKGVLLYFWTQVTTLRIYMSHHKICGVKISHSSNFNLISIALWYKNDVIIFFFLSIVMENDK